MASTIFTSTIADHLKDTLDVIVDDPMDGFEAKAVFSKWCDVETMADQYVDDLEQGGPGLASEVAEGWNIGYRRSGFTVYSRPAGDVHSTAPPLSGSCLTRQPP